MLTVVRALLISRSTVRSKKCFCAEYCFQESRKCNCKCKDHLKGIKERRQRALEESDARIFLDEVDMEEFNEGEADLRDENTADSE